MSLQSVPYALLFKNSFNTTKRSYSKLKKKKCKKYWQSTSSQIEAETIRSHSFHFRTQQNFDNYVSFGVGACQILTGLCARVWACRAHGHRRCTAFARFSTYETFSASLEWDVLYFLTERTNIGWSPLNSIFADWCCPSFVSILTFEDLFFKRD